MNIVNLVYTVGIGSDGYIWTFYSLRKEKENINAPRLPRTVAVPSLSDPPAVDPPAADPPAVGRRLVIRWSRSRRITTGTTNDTWIRFHRSRPSLSPPPSSRVPPPVAPVQHSSSGISSSISSGTCIGRVLRVVIWDASRQISPSMKESRGLGDGLESSPGIWGARPSG